MTESPIPPLGDAGADALLRAMTKVHRRLASDLLERASDPRVEPSLREAHHDDTARGRTGEPFETYREAFCAQVGASWILCAVFTRTLEDRGYVPHRLASPGASDRLAQFRAQFKFLGERDYLLHVFDAMALLPGGREIFGASHAPLWRLSPSSRAIADLLDELRAADDGVLRFTFGRPEGEEHDGASTRYLGDLYQDLNEGVRKRFALLQTPEFVERFLLENTLDPALRERGIAVTMIDPACGSGHLLLGAYDRLFEARRRVEPGKSLEESARKALAQVHGIDLNPYAAAIARFRLLLSYLDKAGLRRLEDVSESLGIRVYVGDSLLAGWGGVQETLGDDQARRGTEADGLERGALYSFFEEEVDALLRKTRFDVVVANPPYITEKDAKKRELIRERYVAAAGKYALSAPFVERIFQLGNEGGFTGQITANSFMKRDFGKKLIEEVLPKVDLTEMLDTSGAFIPGHGTPTVILFGRARRPLGSQVRVAMGSRGEPTTPEVPAEGKVWSAIAGQHENAGYEDEYISVADLERDKLARHPWSVGGGGAAELKELLEERAQKRLGDIADSIGVDTITRASDLLDMSADGYKRTAVETSLLRGYVVGDEIRDWSISPGIAIPVPYDSNHDLLDTSGFPGLLEFLWPHRYWLRDRFVSGGTRMSDVGQPFWGLPQYAKDKRRTPLSIVFAFVATHNHFVLDRGGKVFKQSAPLIKLAERATEEEYLALLAYLNSSIANFLARELCHSKGAQGVNEGIKSQKWEQFLEHSGAAVGEIALLPELARLLPFARELDSVSQARSSMIPARLIERGAPIDRREFDALSARMVLLQEEIDWTCYELAGLPSFLDVESTRAGLGLRPELRCCEVLVAQSEEPNAWFERHGRQPCTRPADRLTGSQLTAVENRLELVRSDRRLAILESLEHKRRWEPFEWNAAVRDACESWLLGRAESAFADHHTPTSTRALAHTLQSDPKVCAVAEVLTGSTTYDLEALLGDLIDKESVASATCQRYTDVGISKRREWERTWDLQRLEDSGEKPDIPVPRKYDQKDFENAGVVWRHRGKLDVPKERFIAYPTATPPPGATGKAGLVVGWAGWNHLEQLDAAIKLWQAEFPLVRLIPRATRAERQESPDAAHDEALQSDAAARERLMPILQTMADLLPWVRQWHDADGETALAYEGYVSEQARELGVSLDEARAYRRPARVAGKPKKSTGARKKSPRVKGGAE